tara:strand:+ start:3605 stop:4660 length:1056 start_codon:yes stop_codon:yes gene_type:complete
MALINPFRHKPGYLVSDITQNQDLFYSRPPVLYWNFEDGSGSTVTDVSEAGNSFDGTIYGSPIWDGDNPLVGSYSLYFSNSFNLVTSPPTQDYQYIKVDDLSAELYDKNYFAISMWIKTVIHDDVAVGHPHADQPNHAGDSLFDTPYFWSMQNQGPSSINKLGGHVYQQPATTAGWASWFETSSTADARMSRGSPKITDNQWNHIVWVYQQGNHASTANATGVSHRSFFYLYVDGKFVTGTDSIFPDSAASQLESDDHFNFAMELDSSWDAGDPNSGPSSMYIGWMDEVTVWDFYLSPGQVEVIYNGGTPHDMRWGIPRSAPDAGHPKYNQQWERGDRRSHSMTPLTGSEP